MRIFWTTKPSAIFQNLLLVERIILKEKDYNDLPTCDPSPGHEEACALWRICCTNGERGWLIIRGVRKAPTLFWGWWKKGFLTSAQSRFSIVVFDFVLGPLRIARHTWWYPCVSRVLDAIPQVRLRALEWYHVSSNKPFAFKPEKGVARRNGRE